VIPEDPNPFVTIERLNASIMASYIELAQLSERNCAVGVKSEFAAFGPSKSQGLSRTS